MKIILYQCHGRSYLLGSLGLNHGPFFVDHNHFVEVSFQQVLIREIPPSDLTVRLIVEAVEHDRSDSRAEYEHGLWVRFLVGASATATTSATGRARLELKGLVLRSDLDLGSGSIVAVFGSGAGGLAGKVLFESFWHVSAVLPENAATLVDRGWCTGDLEAEKSIQRIQ